MKDKISKRARAVLEAVILDYIDTVEPVSSRAIASRHSFALSPATIRNTMAELTAAGYLAQPHTSAGRVPTEKSFRLYVDTLVETLPTAGTDGGDLKRMQTIDYHSPEDFLRETTKVLSSLTLCAGFVLPPRPDRLVIKDIRFLAADPKSVVVIVVSAEGLVYSKKVRVGTAAGALDLEKMSNYLNSIGRGLSLEALKKRVVEELRKEKNLYDELVKKALELGEEAFEQVSEETRAELYLDGKANIFEQPEFSYDTKRMKRVVAALEEMSLLVKILDRSIEDGGINICIGSESRIYEFQGLSFISAPYGRCGETLGAVGVIGPVRMNYSRIIPLVNCAAGFIGDAL